MILQCPLLHEADARGADAIDEELRVVERAEELAHERIRVPNLLQQRTLSDNLCEAGQAHLVMSDIHVAKLDLGIGGDFSRLVIEPQVGDVDRKAVAPDRRHRPDPRLVAGAIDASRATFRKIKQNLFWAFIYNLIGIPLAAFGFLSPALAGAAMAMSSVSVVTNSLLLRSWTPRLKNATKTLPEAT